MFTLKEIYAAVSKVVTLTQETQKNKADIKQAREELDKLERSVQHLNQQVHELTLVMQRTHYETQLLRSDIQHFREENARHDNEAAREREVLVLRLENRLLRFERQLPPPKSDDET